MEMVRAAEGVDEDGEDDELASDHGKAQANRALTECEPLIGNQKKASAGATILGIRELPLSRCEI